MVTIFQIIVGSKKNIGKMARASLIIPNISHRDFSNKMPSGGPKMMNSI